MYNLFDMYVNFVNRYEKPMHAFKYSNIKLGDSYSIELQILHRRTLLFLGGQMVRINHHPSIGVGQWVQRWPSTQPTWKYCTDITNEGTYTCLYTDLKMYTNDK